MKPSTKFALGAVVILGAVSLLMVEGIKQTGTYFLTPSQLVERTTQDPDFHDVGLKVSAKVVKGSIVRDDAAQRVDFRITDGTQEFPVQYVGGCDLSSSAIFLASSIQIQMSGRLSPSAGIAWLHQRMARSSRRM